MQILTVLKAASLALAFGIGLPMASAVAPRKSRMPLAPKSSRAASTTVATLHYFLRCCFAAMPVVIERPALLYHYLSTYFFAGMLGPVILCHMSLLVALLSH